MVYTSHLEVQSTKQGWGTYGGYFGILESLSYSVLTLTVDGSPGHDKAGHGGTELVRVCGLSPLSLLLAHWLRLSPPPPPPLTVVVL